jgi:2-dehydro-3-deoxy-D-arabinonate dehydratase
MHWIASFGFFCLNVFGIPGSGQSSAGFIPYIDAMKLYKLGKHTYIENEGQCYMTERDWDALINRPRLYDQLTNELPSFEKVDAPDDSCHWDAPAGQQELWASGVTYLRSREARVAESQSAGGGDFYDRVYDADRPELFFKSAPYRIVGQGGIVHIRRDSTWNVPEPELTLFICSAGSIEGYTIGNDMSSRSIEGENPLYLPQAKTYDRSASLGPCLYIPEAPLSMNHSISLSIHRSGAEVFSDTITLERMKRRPEDLASWLFRELSFPNGCYLMTGTGIVPPDHFTLQPGDEVRISIEGIGTLINQVNQSNQI